MEYFINRDYLIKNTSIQNSVDTTDYSYLIKTSSDMYVRSILGTYFYDYLLVVYNNTINHATASATMSSDEITLLNYIKPAVAWRSAADATIELTVQLKNKGLQKQSGDYSQAVDFTEMNFKAHHNADKASFYDNRLAVYLCANKDKYTQFTNELNYDTSTKCNCCDDGLNSSFNPNIFFI